MNVKIRPHNLTPSQKGELGKAAREYFQREVDAYVKKLQWRLTRRTIYAVCLSLSDKFGFGPKRCQRIVEGLIEILSGVAEDVYDKNETDPDGVDRMADNMAAELADRGIVIAIAGDPWYDEIVKIRERKEKESALGAGTRESAKVKPQ